MTHNPRYWIPAIVIAVLLGQYVLWACAVPRLAERMVR